MRYVCPVCMYDNLDEPPYNDEGYGLHEICPCCGFQFGYDDYPDKIPSWTEWRKKWIDDGCEWYAESQLPYKEWSLFDQLKKLQALMQNETN